MWRFDGTYLTLEDGRRYRCAHGKGGMRADKREGDGATPIGRFPLRDGYFREDQLARPDSGLAFRPLGQDDLWCDDPADPAYNRAVRAPFDARHETLWRADRIYDVIVPMGYNDNPPVAGLGSAIFLHVAREGYAPTEGCLALALPDLLDCLKLAGPETVIEVSPA